MRNKLRQRQAYALVIVMLLHVFLPPAAKALTGGPMQPEFSAFEPIGTTEMVNLPDGDFTYNIPLLDVGGYPLNLAYHSGITQDMEASVVGLGWTINPGAINRNVRALPDDFRGEDDAVKKEVNMRPNVTVGVGTVAETELFGKKVTKALGDTSTINLNLGVFINNYHGIGYEFGLNPSIKAATKAENALTGGLGLDAGLGVNSKDGANFSADVSFDGQINRIEKSSIKLKGKIGLAVNSKAGLKSLKLEGTLPWKMYKRKLKQNFSFSTKTYVPGMDFSYNNLSLSFNIKPGDIALFGSSISITGFSGYYSQQKLREKSLSKRAYGLLYAEEGKNDVHALMDFNREHEGALRGYSINLPLVNPGYDVLSLSGQGIGGSYQLKRSDVPIFFDSKSTSVANGGGIGVEVGSGSIFHAGTNLNYNNTNSFAEKWKQDNDFLSAYDFGDGSDGAYEAAYYRAAGEMAVETDLNFYRNLGEDHAVRAYLEQPDFFKPFKVFAQPKLVGDYDKVEASPGSPVTREKRAQRNQVISYLTAEEASIGGLQKVLPSHPLNDFSASPYDLPRIDGRVGRQHHHISQVETVREDGLRYVYGIPAYNLTTEEVSFNVAGQSVDCATGNVIYSPGQDDSADNDRGSDHYYNKITTPAYAHSYLLTAVLGQDYEDVGNDGPSEDDLGTYTLINYSNTTLNLGPRLGMISPYQWRVPFQKDGAHYNAGFFSKKGDDRASYVYGKKEIWLVHSVESKTMIAEFFYEEDRQDGFGVANQHGGFAADNPNKILKKVTLYAKPDRLANGDDATPIKTVHFNYDYELCPGTLNSRAGGKLTLKEVYFTHGHSQKGKLSSYKFSYKKPTAPYDGRAYDRWGNYLPNNQNNNCQKPEPGDSIPNDEFPYSTQDPVLAENVAGTWCLNQIKLPSGGEINVEYGAKHYAYVQDQPAMQMVKITGTNAPDGKSLYEDNDSSYLRLTLDLGGGSMEDYLDGIRKNKDYIYLRCYLNLNGKTGSDAKYEYVSLYSKISDYGANWIELVELPSTGRDNGPQINPISKFGFQYVREHLPKIAFGETTVKPEDISLKNPLAFLRPMAAIGRQTRSFFKGFNKTLIGREMCRQIDVQGRSYVRLMTPDGMKYGGGSLVKRITITDNWADMTGGAHRSFTYGQEYDYTTMDPETGRRISSGVAAYEPILGGDENPLRQPIEVNEERRWAIDNVHYVEEPLGEALMPGPRIVYGEIRVQNLSRPNVNRTATGYSILKYYTAKDFPVKVDRTGLSKKPRRMPPVLKVLQLKIRDHMTASQGFVVETNNMHGQARGREVYDENGTLISSTAYHYKTKADGSLDNTVEVMDDKGRLRPALLGVDYDLAGDAREAKTKTVSAGAQINVDGFPVAFFPAIVPMVWPSFSMEEKRFRSMSLTKQVKKYGVLDRVEAFDLGSSIATENRVWDAETGEVLLTKTYNEFEDPVYNLKIPAHLYYAGMQGAYQNISATAKLTNLGGGLYSVPDGDMFIPGDEVLVSGSGGPMNKAWVLHANAVFDKIFLIDANGTPESTFGTGNTVKVIRSGHRNMPTAAIGTVTSLQNPFVGNRLRLDPNTEVLNAEAVEYSDQWQTFCSDETVEGRYCFPEGQVNPFTRGIWGNWRAKRSWLYLTDREQQPLVSTTSTTNLRKDGSYLDFAPFWRYRNLLKTWQKQDAGWEWTTEVTKINPNGTELENRDRLNRHAAEILGYYNQLVTGVAANSKYQQIAFEGFEDYYYNANLSGNNCPLERHFGADIDPDAVTKKTYHTGKYALEVSPRDKRETSYRTSGPCVTAGSAPGGQPYTTGDCDCVPTFSPEPGHYVVTAWVKEGDGLGAYQYQNHRLRVITQGTTVANTNSFAAKGKVIEGWQRIEGVFEVRDQDQTVSVVFESTGNDVAFFDDLRIFPYDGDMKNFVYDDVTLKLLSEIDANGYASFYEYDASGELVRIKKETERGLMTVQESASALPKKR